MSLKLLITTLLSLALLPGCLSATAYTSPEGRITDFSAYTLRPGEVRTGLGFVGRTIDDVGLSIPLEVGLPYGGQVSTNIGHDVAPLINADLEWNFLDRKHFGLGARVGIKWTNPTLFYWLDEESREDFGDIDTIFVPVSINTSYPITSWFDAHLDVGYLHSAVYGTAETSGVSGSGAFSSREVFLHPKVAFYIVEKVAILLGAYVPVYAKALVKATSESEVKDGTVVGAEVSAYEKIDVKGLFTVYAATEMRWGPTHLRLGVVYGMRFLNQRLSYVLPNLDLYWRF